MLATVWLYHTTASQNRLHNYTATAMNPWTCFQTYSSTILVTTTSWGVLQKYAVTEGHYNQGHVKLYFQIQPELIYFNPYPANMENMVNS
jgi:hypothetical protein